jgi:hypothetical protein
MRGSKDGNDGNVRVASHWVEPAVRVGIKVLDRRWTGVVVVVEGAKFNARARWCMRGLQWSVVVNVGKKAREQERGDGLFVARVSQVDREDARGRGERRDNDVDKDEDKAHEKQQAML